MSTLASAVIDTGSNRIIHRNFIIQEAYEPGKGNVWEWAHEDFDRVTFPVSGSCQTIFECIDAVNAWHQTQEQTQ